MMHNEMNLRQQYQDSNNAQQATHKVEKVEKDDRWPNYYKDQDPLPQVTKDLDAAARR